MKRIYRLMAEYADGTIINEERQAEDHADATAQLEELIRLTANGAPLSSEVALASVVIN